MGGRRKGAMKARRGALAWLAMSRLKDFPEKETPDSCRMNRSWPGRKASENGVGRKLSTIMASRCRVELKAED